MNSTAKDLTEQTVTAAVVESFTHAPDPRLRELLQKLVPHLHAFVCETRLTLLEWETAIEFLTAVGQKCDDTRQEFILLSDVLGISMLTETINGAQQGTESTVLGPFHLTESPKRANGDCIDLLGGKVPCVVTGRVLDADGTPLPGASVDVWQCTEDGFYDVQQPDLQPAGNGRGLFTTDGDGAFHFRTVVPSHYPIPTDGPVGELLAATHRHPYRPAHIHFIAEASGHTPLTTHIFVANGPYLDSDAVFAVKQSLIADFSEVSDPALAEKFGVAGPFRIAEIDLVLEAT
jgi:catechol 1,2-dioxygenase/hydroxyquinol 1,2-dioxygenase